MPTDLSVSHLEITRVVQDWDNRVPLVAGKATVVRVYVAANGPPGPEAGGKIQVSYPLMDVYRGSTYIGTLGATNGPILVAPTPIDPQTLRPDVNSTFNFLLPSSWVSPTTGINVRLTLNTTGAVPDSNSSNDSVTQNLSFVQTRPLNVAGLMFASPDHPFGAVPYTDFNRQLGYLVRTWPTGRIYLNRLATDRLYYGQVSNPNDASDTYFPGADRVIADANTLRQQASSPYNGFNWYVL